MTRKEAIDKVYGMIGTEEQHEALEFLIPEVRKLREFYEKTAEDNRIRREIISALKFANDGGVYNEHIAYLEKQKEQKPASNNTLEEDIKLYYDTYGNGKGGFDYMSYPKFKDIVETFVSEHGKEQDFPYGVNETVDKLIAIAECLEMDGDCLINGYTGTECGKFLRDLARKQVECKLEKWSEEDEKMLNSIINVVCGVGSQPNGLREKQVNFLKSLSPQWKPSEEKYDRNMDKECIKLCDILNSIPSVDTFESCCGHLKDRYSIWFFCNDIIAISRLGRCVERNYSDGKWELLVDTTDTHLTGVFWLRSKIPFQSYDEMEESVNELCINIQYWFNAKFDSYFNDSAKQNYQWEPSEEQMKALEQWLKDKQYDGDSRYVYPIFESLYKQLKSCSYENNR